MRSEKSSGSGVGRRGRHVRCGRAFTLIELLVVVAIIAILVAVLVPAVNRVRHQAKVSRVEAQIKVLDVAINSFATDQGSFPVSDPWADPRIEKNLTPTGAHALALALVGDPLGNTPLAKKAYMGVDKANATDDFQGFADVEGFEPPFLDRPNDPNFWGYLFKDVSFGGPILYYRANRRATYSPVPEEYALVGDQLRTSGGDVLPDNGSAVYHIADNALITGAPGALAPADPPPDWNGTGWPWNSQMFTGPDGDVLGGFADWVEVENTRVPGGGPVSARAQNADSFLLVSPGPDLKFGFVDGGCDDIGNFEVPTQQELE